MFVSTVWLLSDYRHKALRISFIIKAVRVQLNAKHSPQFGKVGLKKFVNGKGKKALE